MENFLMRSVTEKNEDYGISVSRTRDTTGFAGITIIVGNQRLDLLNGTKENGFDDDYENAAYVLSDLIEKVAENPCLLTKGSD